MNIAIIGCGNIANTHAEEVTKLGHKIVAAIGTNAEKTKAFGQQWGASYMGDSFERALESDIDCVNICTPAILHYEMVKRVVEIGRAHV